MQDDKEGAQAAEKNHRKNWQDDASTLIWAQLHLGEVTGEEVRKQIESLFQEVKDNDWIEGIKKEMDFYNERFPKNEVKLSL